MCQQIKRQTQQKQGFKKLKIRNRWMLWLRLFQNISKLLASLLRLTVGRSKWFKRSEWLGGLRRGLLGRQGFN